MSFQQHAKGSFAVDVQGQFHCGPNHDSPKRFDFEVTIHYPANALDSQGFLLDNTAFKGYFESLGRTELSCELLAKTACEYFDSLAGDRAQSIDVAIWGIPDHARISYRIEKPPKAIPASA
jgi:hypothetical protein